MHDEDHYDEPYADEEGEAGAESSSDLGGLDGLLDEFDFEELVRRYPLPALALAAVGGFILARTRGSDILSAASNLAVGHVAAQVNSLLGDDVV